MLHFSSQGSGQIRPETDGGRWCPVVSEKTHKHVRRGTICRMPGLLFRMPGPRKKGRVRPTPRTLDQYLNRRLSLGIPPPGGWGGPCNLQPAALQPAALQPAACSLQPAALQPAALQPAALQRNPCRLQPCSLQPAAQPLPTATLQPAALQPETLQCNSLVPQRLPGTSREQSLSIVGTFWAAKRPGMPQKCSRNAPGVLPGAPRGSKTIKGPNPRFSVCLPLTTLRQGKGCDPVRTARPPRPTAIYMQAYYEGILEHPSKPSWLRKL
jgi:hypothetical protein